MKKKPAATLEQLGQCVVDGARRRVVEPFEWLRLRRCEVSLAFYLLDKRDFEPRTFAAMVRTFGVSRLAALLYAHYDADSFRQAIDTIDGLIACWERGERV